MDPGSTPSGLSADLAALEKRQARLYEALAQFHQARTKAPELCPCAAGLAIYHRVAVFNGSHAIEAVLVHAEGGEISSGFLPLESVDGIFRLQAVTAAMLLSEFSGGSGPESPQPQEPAAPQAPQQQQAAHPPLMLQQEPILSQAAAPTPDPEPSAAPAAPSDEPPTKEEVSALIDDLDKVFNRRPSRVKELTAGFRAEFEIGPKTPVAKAITTRARLDWLRESVDQLLTEIAEFDQNVAAAEKEVAA
jgi:hypothetical protein